MHLDCRHGILKSKAVHEHELSRLHLCFRHEFDSIQPASQGSLTICSIFNEPQDVYEAWAAG